MLTITAISKSLGTSPDLIFPPLSTELTSLLTAFTKYASELAHTEFLKKWKSLSVTLHKENGKAPWITGIIPSDQELWMTFHKLRSFQLQKEPTYYPKVCNALARHFRHKALQLLFDLWKHQFLGHWLQNAVSIRAGEYQINSEDFFNKYLNAIEYHHDPEILQVIDSVSQWWPPETQRGIIVLLLHAKVSTIATTASFIDRIERCSKGTPFSITGP